MTKNMLELEHQRILLPRAQARTCLPLGKLAKAVFFQSSTLVTRNSITTMKLGKGPPGEKA
jgi:hypothetical protein